MNGTNKLEFYITLAYWVHL